jgi:CRP/FNR family cyclic AMP-dependent transcriptional regulator
LRDLRENLTLALQVFCGNFRSQLRESSQVMSKDFHNMAEQHQAHGLPGEKRNRSLNSPVANRYRKSKMCACHQATTGRSAMRGANKQTAGEDNDVENGQEPILSCASPLHAIDGFERITTGKVYPRGAALFVEGQAASGVYVLCAGRVKLWITSAGGKKLIVRIARPGDLLGIHAALTGHSYEATAETLAPCRIDFISRTDLLGFLDRQKSFGLGLAMAVSKDFTEFVAHARTLLLSISAAEKLARLLMAWSDAFGQHTPVGIHLQTLLTHEELGQMIGVSRETVTRTLNALKREQVIRTKNGDLWIRDRVALAALANSGPR